MISFQNSIQDLSSSPDQVFFVLLYFVMYLGSVFNSAVLLTIGSVDRHQRWIILTPFWYYLLIPLHGRTLEANVDLLWQLTFQWTVPAAFLGHLLGRILRGRKK